MVSIYPWPDHEPARSGSPPRYLFYLESGNCVFSFDSTNTAEKLFSVTLATAKPKVRLGNLAYHMEKVKTVEGRDWRRRCGTCGG